MNERGFRVRPQPLDAAEPASGKEADRLGGGVAHAEQRVLAVHDQDEASGGVASVVAGEQLTHPTRVGSRKREAGAEERREVQSTDRAEHDSRQPGGDDDAAVPQRPPGQAERCIRIRSGGSVDRCRRSERTGGLLGSVQQTMLKPAATVAAGLAHPAFTLQVPHRRWRARLEPSAGREAYGRLAAHPAARVVERTILPRWRAPRRSRPSAWRSASATSTALRGVSFEALPGSVLGLLGPNGAGKTTAVRILTTLLTPDMGSALVGGIDVTRHPARVRAQIGLAGQYAAVDENLTGFENLEMVGRLYHLGRGTARERATELLDEFGLADASDRLVRTYSGGMRRRLDLAAALVARPPILFLDEPTTGLDIRSRIALWDSIETLVAAGTTVLLTTQYLEEADRLAHRIAVVNHGVVIAEGTSAELKRRVGGDRLEIRLASGSDVAAAAIALARVGTGAPIAVDGRLSIPIEHGSGAVTVAVRRLDESGIEIEDIATQRPTLDDVFLQLTGQTAAEAEAEAESE